MTTEYRWTGNHPQDFADGRIVEPNGTIKLDADAQKHPHNQGLLESGLLLEITKPSRKEE